MNSSFSQTGQTNDGPTLSKTSEEQTNRLPFGGFGNYKLHTDETKGVVGGREEEGRFGCTGMSD